MNYKKIISAVLTLVFVVSLTACGGPSYKDGTYEGEHNNNGNVATVKITLKEGVITECSAEFRDKTGEIKGENYGKDRDKASYEKAQIAAKNMVKYPEKLVEVGSLEGLEAISGATISYKEFKAAVEDALLKSEQ